MKYMLILFCFCTKLLSAQGELSFRNYTLEDGLPTNTVYECYQDSNGYIYVGHNKGVSVFNGLSFQTPLSQEKLTALSNFISFTNGNVMCRNFQGKQYLLADNRLESFEGSFKKIWGFPTYLEDGDQHYAFQNDVFYEINEIGKGRQIKLPISDLRRIYHGIIQKGIAYIYYDDMKNSVLVSFDLATNQIINQRKFRIGQNVIPFKGRDGAIWIEERTGLAGTCTNNMNDEAQLYSSAIPKNSKITGFIELKNGAKLISTFNGVYRLDSNWQFVAHYLKGIQCTHLLLDKDEGLWISSLQNGLYYAPNNNVVQLSASVFEGVNVKFSKVYKHDRFMYIGTYDGRVFKINTNGELVTSFDFNRKVEIQSMHIAEDKLFVFCGGLLIIDLSTGYIVDQWESSACKSIYAKGDLLVFGTSKGLLLYENQTLKNYVDSLWVMQAYPLSNESFILECAENIMLFDIKTKELSELQSKGLNLCQIEDKWYFRTTNSVYEWDGISKRQIYTSSIDIDQLYISEGRPTVDLENRQSFQLFGEKFKQEKRLSICLLNDVTFVGELGDYYYKGNNNCIQFVPKSMVFIEATPEVLLVEVSGNFSVDKNKYILPYSDNELILEFDVLPNYHLIGASNVYYRIVGLNEVWKIAQKSERYKVELLRIPPGSYTLEIYAKSVESHSATQFYQLEVKQPYYFQWWFILQAIILFVGLTFVLVLWRARIIAVKSRQMFEEQQLKMRALNSELVAIRSQMNPHFIFNSLSSIQTKILHEDRVEAYQNVNTFATLLRQALLFTSKEFISLQEELEFTRNYITLELNRTAHAFKYQEQIDPKLDLNSLHIPSLFLQPFVENAIRHGLLNSKREKLLLISMAIKDKGFEVIIEDNGIGRKASAAINVEQRPDHTSFATSAIQDRIDILRQSLKMKIDLKIEDLAHGTRVIINFETI